MYEINRNNYFVQNRKKLLLLQEEKSKSKLTNVIKLTIISEWDELINITKLTPALQEKKYWFPMTKHRKSCGKFSFLQLFPWPRNCGKLGHG